MCFELLHLQQFVNTLYEYLNFSIYIFVCNFSPYNI